MQLSSTHWSFDQASDVDPARPSPHNRMHLMWGGVGNSVIEHLPSMCKVLGVIPGVPPFGIIPADTFF
jgi:hypothetical protein